MTFMKDHITHAPKINQKRGKFWLICLCLQKYKTGEINVPTTTTNVFQSKYFSAIQMLYVIRERC